MFGLGRFFQEVGFLIGALLSFFVLFAVSSDWITIEGALLFGAAFLLVFVMIAISSQDRLPFSIQIPDKAVVSIPSTNELLASTTAEIAQKYGLTKRESEIFSYLAKGHSLPYNRNELYIAQSTIDTHVRHIYSKLDIHSREELINLVHDTIT